MIFLITLLLGMVSFFVWLMLEITWLRYLRGANGQRPFIALTLRAGHVFFVDSILLLLALAITNHSNWAMNQIIVWSLHAPLSLFAAFSMWRLHHLVLLTIQSHKE